jgi:hypothetical protein
MLGSALNTIFRVMIPNGTRLTVDLFTIIDVDENLKLFILLLR